MTKSLTQNTNYKHAGSQGPSQDFHNRVSKLGFQESRVSKIKGWKIENQYTDYVY